MRDYTLKRLQLEGYRIAPEKGDPVVVVLDEQQNWRRILISTYDRALKGEWGGAGNCLKKFLLGCDECYLGNIFMRDDARVIDFEKTIEKLQKRVIAERRDQHIDEYDARELYDALGDIEDDINIRELYDALERIDQIESIADLSEEVWHGDLIEWKRSDYWQYFFKHVWPLICDVFEKEISEGE